MLIDLPEDLLYSCQTVGTWGQSTPYSIIGIMIIFTAIS